MLIHTTAAYNAFFRKNFFCAAITERKEIVKKDGDSVEEILPVLSESSCSWIDLKTDDFKNEARATGKALGFSDALLSLLDAKQTTGYLDLDVELGIRIPAISVKNLVTSVEPVIILLANNLVVTIHTPKTERFVRLRRYAETFLRKISPEYSPEDRITTILIRLLDENNTRNFEKLRAIEEQSDKLNEWLMDPETPITKIGPEIHKMKHALMVYLRLLWASGDIFNEIRDGDAALISDRPEVLAKISNLTQDITSHIALTEHLSNVLTSGLEVLQSIYNNQLQTFNNRIALLMGYLTIVGTAVLVPNTLGTILSGAAFNVGHNDLFWYVPLLVISTIASTYGVYIWVKKKGWLTQIQKRG